MLTSYGLAEYLLQKRKEACNESLLSCEDVSPRLSYCVTFQSVPEL